MPRPRTIQTPGEAPTEDTDTTVIDAPTPSAAEQSLPDQSEIDPTLQQAQAALASAQTAQANLTRAKGVQ